MKTTKLLFCGAVMSLCSLGVYAQKSTAIIKGGVNIANVSNKDNGGYNDANALTTWQAGIIGDFEVTDFFAIQPGLLYTGKGLKWQNGESGDATYQRLQFNPQYLELPVNLVFKTPTGGVRFFAGAGPYVAMGVGGKFKADGLVNFKESIQWSDDDPLTSDEEGAGAFRAKRFDYGLNALVGVEASNLVISANYGLGLAKIQSGANSSNDDNNKHRVLSFTVGYKF
ncbi:PorT family protein [Terrimonas sp. NA20]|uniref:PorT family protein n=1 Tax=Terrimonas ginsenosidimutans TaxID=2908004 RepID=A0ABS9KXR4_9BACT|nr:porin family protein [Terrimonas ginsenosidimutans]MCG2617101.1 PorT family protein [Terrimonas ginsenosidimutans]